MRQPLRLSRALTISPISRDWAIGLPCSSVWKSCAAATSSKWDAQEGRRIYGRIIPSETGMRHSVLRQPIGVVAAFSPWNFPMSSPARKVGGALSAGCSIILKPSEEMPAGAVQLVQAFANAGLPAGVLSLVFAKPSDISEYLIPQPAVRLVTFTGSVPVGKHLSAMAGAHMKPAIMELGGHAPVIMCDDIDPVSSASTSAVAKSRNADRSASHPHASSSTMRSTTASQMPSPRRLQQ
jgi:succinate-semialdehyde dehydrogenase / glutarate-semialdehyde dehydrogenase